MSAALAIVIGLLVIVGLVYGAITTFRTQQAALARRQAEREASGEADELRRIHAEREARAGDE
ncbi:MAG: hypothetical protein J7513_12180 [Solirubrobacteraceae bacterium]|nr:hypothetical protein [Solirubrobacteraceae bacterium]